MRNSLTALSAAVSRPHTLRTLFGSAARRSSLSVYISAVTLSLMAAVFLPLPMLSQNYLLATGKPSFTTAAEVEMGFINMGNGNLHIEIPLTSSPERGGRGFTAKLAYDSRIWQPVSNGTSSTWQPTNVSTSKAGWRLVTNVDPGIISYTYAPVTCGGTLLNQVWLNFVWTDPNGTPRMFAIQTSFNQCTSTGVSSGNAYAEDSSGFHMYVTNYTHATIFAKDGTQVSPSVKDTNGNYFSTDGSGNVIDTLGRTQIVTTVNGSSIYYDVLNSQGATSRYTVTTETISVKTAFGQPGIAEYSGTLPAIQTITLPDNSAYGFTYDSGTTGNYGVLTSMSLPVTGTITYSYSTFSDAYGNRNRWLQTRTSGGGTWTYAPQVISTCTSGQVGCQQKTTLTRPSNDLAVYTFTLNNGAWNTQALLYNGSSQLLRTTTSTFDFSNSCPLSCTGAAYIRPLSLTVTDPVPSRNISRQTQWAYDSIYFGNFSAVKEWEFYSGTLPASPTRETDTVYVTTSSYAAKDIHNKPATITVKNSSGVQLAYRAMSYDTASLTSVTGIAQHDDTNFGTGNTVRGNVTQLEQWVSGTGCTAGTATCLTTTYTYDTTGQVLQKTNARNYTQLYSYADVFYSDNGANPPASYTAPKPTNAYVTLITLVNSPGSGTLSYAYYFNTGKITFDKDENLSAVYRHYLDSLDRLTDTYYRKLTNGTRGWQLINYASETEWGVYTGITDTTPSISCTGCRHDRIDYDIWGRGPITHTLINDPDGVTYAQSDYGPVGRLVSVSNPYRTTNDPTYGVDTYTHDGLDRLTSITHQDGNVLHKYFGSDVTAAGGASSQLCSTSTYGYGYPTLAVDEAGKKSQHWTNRMGSPVEVDEPDSSNSLTVPTCYTYDANGKILQVVQGSQSRTYSYDGLSRPTSVHEPESGATSLYYTTSGGSVCSGNSADLCRRTDGRSITSTYVYDSIDRLTNKTYSDSTPAATYYYDQTSYNGLTVAYGGGRLTGMSDGSGITAWSYDPAGHVITERRTISGITKTTSYSYNIDGSVAAMTYPSGHTITYAYSAARRAVSAVDTASSINYALSATYAPQDKLASVVYGKVTGGFAGVSRSRSYNNRLQVATMVDSSSNGTIQNLSYSFNLGSGKNNGNVASVTDGLVSGRSQSYTYDNLNRVSSAQTQATSGSDCWGQSFGYDRYANLLSTAVTQCSAPSLNVSVNNNNQITGFTYDAAGNLTNDGSNSYVYNAENQLKTTAGVNYTYDGKRIRTAKSSGILYWPGSDGTLLAESDTSGNITHEYVYFAGRKIARRESSGAVYYYFADRLHSSRAMTDNNGNIQQASVYYPYGGELIVNNNVPNEFKFTGKIRDSESGLDNSQYRMYSSSLGRWLSSDPGKRRVGQPQTLNRYGYVRANSTNLTDALGLEDDIAEDDGGGGGGGGGGGDGGGGGGSDAAAGDGGGSVTVTAPAPDPVPTETSDPPATTIPLPGDGCTQNSDGNITCISSAPMPTPDPSPQAPTTPDPITVPGTTITVTATMPGPVPTVTGGGNTGTPQTPTPTPTPKPTPKPAPKPTPGPQPRPPYTGCQKWATANYFAGAWSLGFAFSGVGTVPGLVVGGITGGSAILQGLACGIF
jgi:RHS repeat-associated protein